VTRAAALVLAILGVLWARQIGNTAAVSSAGTALVVGFMLVGAWLTGDLLKRFRLPQLTGHLAFGMVMGPYLGNVITASMAGQLQFITGIATTLIALIAGLTLNVDRLGGRLLPILQTTVVTLAIPIVVLLGLGWVAWPWLDIAPDAAGLTRFSMVALLAIVAVSFSPTMTAAVMAEVGDRSRLSELVLTMVVVADLLLLVMFAAAMQGARAVFAANGDFAFSTFLIHVIWETGGAAAFGVLVGSLFVLYLRHVGREIPLVLVALCTLLSQVAAAQQFEPLLAAVVAGFVIENLAVKQGDTLRLAVREGAPPVLVLFFVSVGASLRLDAIAIMGALAVALVALRLGLVWLGVRTGLRVSGLDEPTGQYAWTGLISQAGITLGFVAVVATEFPGWGERLQLLVVGAMAINELIGPVAFRYALVRAGDVGAHTPRPMIVVSNREPYLHSRSSDGQVTVAPATGGVAVALDALMRERGGVWIAHGAGSADHEVVDERDKVQVPPETPTYALRRLWLEEPMFSAYYGGFSNEGLWPLCHVVDVRPKFRAEDWNAYRIVNARFARAVHDELGDSDAPVFIQDYHLALVAPALRRLRPDARTAIFWHIPWPYPDRLRICPWRREILTGLLANDLIAFQLERDRRNFLYAVEEELGAEIEEEASRVYLEGRHSTVISVPIGVDYDRIQRFIVDPALVTERSKLCEQFGLTAPIIGLGVDRLDYTKGIPERLAALDALISSRPDLRGRLTFLQIGVPSRSALDSYAAVETEIGRMVAELNAKHCVEGASPLVVLSTSALEAFSLTALYRVADFCVVSSLHDGMNLVAKEFVAARDDNGGVLVLSALAGAAHELQDAVIINPYDVEGFARELGAAIDMPADERARRMRAMRKIVAGRNVFGWASDILEGLESLWTKPLLYSVRGWEDTGV
jgi:trehalose-6-phosphate synthase/Kef-type K+ transport system membrane component KefB